MNFYNGLTPQFLGCIAQPLNHRLVDLNDVARFIQDEEKIINGVKQCLQVGFPFLEGLLVPFALGDVSGTVINSDRPPLLIIIDPGAAVKPAYLTIGPDDAVIKFGKAFCQTGMLGFDGSSTSSG